MSCYFLKRFQLTKNKHKTIGEHRYSINVIILLMQFLSNRIFSQSQSFFCCKNKKIQRLDCCLRTTYFVSNNKNMGMATHTHTHIYIESYEIGRNSVYVYIKLPLHLQVLKFRHNSKKFIIFKTFT